MSCFKRLQRFLAGVVMVTFFVTNTLTPAPVAYAANVESPAFTSDFKIPSEFGKITDIIPSTLAGGHQATLIHIQEAHANYDAQKNIRNILQCLAKDYGIKLILLEGAGNKLAPELFNFFPQNAELQRAVNDKLLKAGELTGAEVFLIDNRQQTADHSKTMDSGLRSPVSSHQSDGKAVEAYGIENAEAYAENREAYRRVYKGRKLTESFLDAFYRQWQKSSDQVLSKPLREFLGRESDFEEGRLPLQDWIAFLKTAAERHLKLDLNDTYEQRAWPILVRYFRLKKIDSQIDPAKAQKEQEAFLKDLRARKVPASLLQEITKFLKPENAGDLPPYKTRFTFERLMDLLPKDYSFEPYPVFRLYVQQRILLSELQGEQLQGEIKALVRKISAGLIKTEQERKFVEILQDHRLLKKLFKLELSREEFREIQSQQVTPEEMIAALELNSSKLSSITSLFGAAIHFYEGAIKREDFMMQRAREVMAERKETKAVIITGGFHTDGFKEKITASGSSYIGITPVIGEITVDSKKNYLAALFGASVIAQSHIAPEAITQPSFFRAVSPRFWRRELAVRFARIRDLVRQVMASFHSPSAQDMAKFDAEFQKLTASAVEAPSQHQVERQRGKQIFSLTQADLQGAKGMKVFDFLMSRGIQEAALQNSILTVQSKFSNQVYKITIGNEHEASPYLAVDQLLGYLGIRDISDVVSIEGHSNLARETEFTARSEMRNINRRGIVPENSDLINELWPGYEVQIAGVFGAANTANTEFLRNIARWNIADKLTKEKIQRSETRFVIVGSDFSLSPEDSEAFRSARAGLLEAGESAVVPLLQSSWSQPERFKKLFFEMRSLSPQLAEGVDEQIIKLVSSGVFLSVDQKEFLFKDGFLGQKALEEIYKQLVAFLDKEQTGRSSAAEIYERLTNSLNIMALCLKRYHPPFFETSRATRILLNYAFNQRGIYTSTENIAALNALENLGAQAWRAMVPFLVGQNVVRFEKEENFRNAQEHIFGFLKTQQKFYIPELQKELSRRSRSSAKAAFLLDRITKLDKNALSGISGNLSGENLDMFDLFFNAQYPTYSEWISSPFSSDKKSAAEQLHKIVDFTFHGLKTSDSETDASAIEKFRILLKTWGFSRTLRWIAAWEEAKAKREKTDPRIFQILGDKAIRLGNGNGDFKQTLDKVMSFNDPLLLQEMFYLLVSTEEDMSKLLPKLIDFMALHPLETADLIPLLILRLRMDVSSFPEKENIQKNLARLLNRGEESNLFLVRKLVEAIPYPRALSNIGKIRQHVQQLDELYSKEGFTRYLRYKIHRDPTSQNFKIVTAILEAIDKKDLTPLFA
ncbi:MAG: hypothetical protein PHV97_03235, partial [Candidatus Omnitrophica bacterium]|nr:hypothetical protein [Candidatus Omnitrophota bacterium]